MKNWSTQKAPEALGPYSQAMSQENLFFTSGQIGIDPQSGKLKEGLENQFLQVLDNLSAVLESADLDWSHVIKTTIYLTDMNRFDTINQLYGKAFLEHKPARSTLGVASLPKGALVEMECIACFPK